MTMDCLKQIGLCSNESGLLFTFLRYAALLNATSTIEGKHEKLEPIFVTNKFVKPANPKTTIGMGRPAV